MENTILKKNGFTLVEIAILLVIIGTVIAGAVSLLSLTEKRDRMQETKDNLEKVEEAVLDFYNINGFLPCPARRTDAIATATYGVSTDCTASEASQCPTVSGNKACEDQNIGPRGIRIGALPNRSLNLPDKYSIDGWGNKFTFIAVSDLAENKANYDSYTDPPSGHRGLIKIYDGGGVSDSNLLIEDITSIEPTVSYLIISHGENAKGAFSLSGTRYTCSANNNDQENCDDDEDFYDQDLDRDGTGANDFDDILRWRTKAELEGAAKSDN